MRNLWFFWRPIVMVLFPALMLVGLGIWFWIMHGSLVLLIVGIAWVVVLGYETWTAIRQVRKQEARAHAAAQDKAD